MGIDGPPLNRAHSGDSEGLDPRLRDLLERAYLGPIDVDVAAGHLWRLDSAARAVQEPATADPTPAATVMADTGAGPRPPGRVRRALATVAVAALLLPSAGVAVAQAHTALPGDVLYQVKLGGERVQLALARTPESDARLYLKFARARLWEAGQIGPENGARIPDLVARAVDNLEAAAAVHAPDVATEVAAARAEASQRIQELGAGLDDEQRVALEETRARLGIDVALTPTEDPAAEPEPEPEPEPVPAPEPATPNVIAEAPEPLSPPEVVADEADSDEAAGSTDEAESGAEQEPVVATGPGNEATGADLGDLDRLPLSGEDAGSDEPDSSGAEPEPEPEPEGGDGQDPGPEPPPETAHADDEEQPVAFFEGGEFSSDDRRPGQGDGGGEDESSF